MSMYVVDMASGECGYWLRYHKNRSQPMKSVQFGKQTNQKIFLCYVQYKSYHAKQAPDLIGNPLGVMLGLWINP